MKIAVCNSNKEILKMLKNTIYCFAEFKRMDLIVDCYMQGENLLKSCKNYGMIILCDRTSDKKALEIAKKIRKLDNKCAIVFLCSDTDYVLEAFKVNAFRFLTEPVKQSDILSVLEDYFEMSGYDYYLWIKSCADTFCVNTGEILYIEADNKSCYIHLKNKKLKCNRTMAMVNKALPENHFLKINRAYVVNADYISGYNRQHVFLKNGESLRVTRNYFEEFKNNYYTQRLPFHID